MNKWSTSLPSIISLCNDVQFNFEPMFLQQSPPSTVSSASPQGNLPSSRASLTDLSALIQTQQPFANYDHFTKNKQATPFYDPPIQSNVSPHAKFVPNDELLQSLVAYADSFELDSSVYSIPNEKHLPTLTAASLLNGQTSLRRRTQSSTTHLTSFIEQNQLTRHKSCEDLSVSCSITSSTSKPTTIFRRNEQLTKANEMKFVPSKSHPQFFFATKADTKASQQHLLESNPKENPIEDPMTTTTASKVEWHFSSDTITEFNNYEPTTNIGDININYLKDLERFSALTASMDFSPEISTSIPSTSALPPPPVVIRKKSKDVRLRQKVDIQLLRPPTPPTPAPIIIREIRPRPPPSNKPPIIQQKLEDTSQIHLSKTPSPIIIRERPPLPPKQNFASKPTILYRRLPTPPPSPPAVIVERLRPHVSAVIKKPPPILLEKWLPYPPEQQRQIIYERASPLPTRNSNYSHDQGKKIIFEYDQVNVIVNKDIKQRRDIKRVSPTEYMKQYGNSFCSHETLQHILSNRTCSSQVHRFSCFD